MRDRVAGRSGTSNPVGSAERLDEIASSIRLLIAEDSSQEAVAPLWTAVPTALLNLSRLSDRQPDKGHRPLSASTRTIASFGSKRRGPSAVSVGDVLFVYDGSNPAHTLEPVIAAYALRSDQSIVRVLERPRARVLARSLRSARRIERMLPTAISGKECLPSLNTALYAAARSLARAEAVLVGREFRLIVVASQHATSSRAFLHIARRLGIPTAYLPHAPVADTHQYRDLPTDFAGLRGNREVEFYRALGCTGQLEIVGNPQADIRVPNALHVSRPIVFAPTPNPPPEIEAQVSLLNAIEQNVIVSPHPRMRTKPMYEKLWPPDWPIHEGKTLELFWLGSPCVVQRSSGIAWEAMAHGIPVIEVTLSGVSPKYPVIREPFARVCATSESLRVAVQRSLDEATDENVRARLIDWARDWCETTGADAAIRGAKFVETSRVVTTPPGPLLDGWAGDQ